MNDHYDNPGSPAQVWLDALNRADADIAAGRIIPAQEIHDRLRAAIDRMQAVAPSTPEAGADGIP